MLALGSTYALLCWVSVCRTLGHCYNKVCASTAAHLGRSAQPHSSWILSGEELCKRQMELLLSSFQRISSSLGKFLVSMLLLDRAHTSTFFANK